MLRSIDELYGDKIGSLDGEIGRVKDFYFDDLTWAVRYVVVDTGSWLPGRKVLITPHAIGGLDESGKVLRAKLTRQKIEDSPSIALHQLVSRQYEEEYYRHYGLPVYWQGGALWGTNSFPVERTPPTPLSTSPQPGHADRHLRSTQAVAGYQLGTKDGTVGHIRDFMVDDRSWAIAELVIKTGHRFTGTEVLIPTRTVQRISYPDSTVYVNLTREAVERSPMHKLAPVGAAD
jgi:sporulation protein YlmC with PRC-barrel domain